MSIMENEEKKIKIGLVIMASGLGKRFGGNKLMELLNNKPLIKWVIDASEDLFDFRIVVTRNRDVQTLCNSMNIKCILHDYPGRNDTVRLGLSEIMNDIDYCFYMQGDQPLISRKSLEQLLLKARENNDKIIRAAYGDISGAPMGFPKLFFNDLLSLPEGKGGNYIAKMNPSFVMSVNVINDYELWDVDTKDDFERIKSVLGK